MRAQNNLLDQDALTIFCEEYAKERNRLQASASQNRNTLIKELAIVKADHAKLVDAILAGIPADQVKTGCWPLTPAPSTIRIHPKIAETYRDKVSDLISQLQEPGGMLETKDTLRGLVDRIVLAPTEPEGKLSVHLHGALAGLLSLSLGSKRKKA